MTDLSKSASPSEPRSQVQSFGGPKPKTWADYRQGCLDTYGGGHHDDGHLEAFRHGMETVFNLLEKEFLPADQCKKTRTEQDSVEYWKSRATAAELKALTFHKEIAKLKAEPRPEHPYGCGCKDCYSQQFITKSSTMTSAEALKKFESEMGRKMSPAEANTYMYGFDDACALNQEAAEPRRAEREEFEACYRKRMVRRWTRLANMSRKNAESQVDESLKRGGGDQYINLLINDFWGFWQAARASAATLNQTAEDLYDAYLLGCEDECVLEPLTRAEFIRRHFSQSASLPQPSAGHQPIRWNLGTCEKDKTRPHLINDNHICREWKKSPSAGQTEGK